MSKNEDNFDNHIFGFKEKINNAKEVSKDSFFTWFNSAEDTDASFIRGSWDFSVHIANPIAKYIKNPENLCAIEIGYGGGRILAAASRYFKNVIGIDVHEKCEYVKNELNSRGIINFNLFTTDGINIPLEDNSVDVVYSFIVLQHVEKINIFNNYISEIFRVLNNGGTAIIYFGRLARYSILKKNILFLYLDRILEGVILKKGYSELTAQVNHTNLIISIRYAKIIASKNGFKVLRTLVSRKNVPDGVDKFGGQNGLILLK